MPPNRMLTRLVFALAALTLVGCAGGAQVRTDPAAVEQWDAVRRTYPQIAAGYTASLLALSDTSPEGIRAREAAFDMARRCGLLRVPPHRPDCRGCLNAPSLASYQECLATRLNCLGPP